MTRWRPAGGRSVAADRRGPVVLGIAAAVLWTLVAAPPVSASSSPTSVSVSAGLLGTTSPAVSDLSIVVLDGTPEWAYGRLQPFALTDARGSGEGWKLTLQATPFREWEADGYVPDGYALPAGSLTLAGLSVTPQGTASAPPVLADGPLVLDGPAVLAATAAADTGMGTFAFDPTSDLTVAIPAHAHAGTYRSELSISVTSGP